MKFFLSLMILVSAAGTGSELPPESIYHLSAPLTNQSGKQHGLDVYRGQPVLVAMFYGSCPAVCPLLIDSVRALENALNSDQKSQLRVLLISIDPERDTPQALLKLSEERQVDLTRWTFARAEGSTVRKIAAVLNIQYRKLPNGDFNHSSVMTFLDRNGRPVMHTSKLGQPDPEVLAAMRTLVAR
jgi:protein SCO1/2